jgi:hypothetical protein
MSLRSLFRASTAMLSLLLVAAAALHPALAASRPARSPLPGYPRFHGVVLVHDGSAATRSREAKIESALIAASTGPRPNCEEGAKPGADVCYWGGPVVRAHKVHLIFWEGTVAQSHPIGVSYRNAIERYFEQVAGASGTASNVYAVQAQYGDHTGAGEYKVSFGGPADVYVDRNELPASGITGSACTDNSAAKGVCVTDADIRAQIEAARTAKNGEGDHWEASLQDIYFVFMPANVGSCFHGAGEAAEPNSCAFEAGGYCAYHSSFESAKKEPEPPLYASIPDDAGVEGCDSFEYPNGSEGVDATLDTTSHEHNETITDPLGNGWLDTIGQEIGDKCLPPETFNSYGRALGGETLEEPTLANPGNAFSQEIAGGHYWLQREWSNEAGPLQGACVQRPIKAMFTISSPRATVPMTFNGEQSGGENDPATYWVWWILNTEEQFGTESPTLSHTFASPGRYRVALIAYDAYGNSQATEGEFTVGAAPPPPLPPGPPTPVTIVLKESITPTHLTAEQVAAELGLPANGRKLTGTGPFALGHGQCPPACGVTIGLYAKVTSAVHGRRTSVLVQIGSTHTTPAAKIGSLSLSLNARGRSLLRKGKALACRLVVSVEGQEGASWQIVRSLSLAGARAARRPRR